jgi:hypothetical protein
MLNFQRVDKFLMRAVSLIQMIPPKEEGTLILLYMGAEKDISPAQVLM